MKLNVFDSHVHTNYSHDAHSTLEEVCAFARDHGVMGLAFTYHYECDIPDQRRGFPQVLEEIPRLQEQHKGWLRITKGVELGQPQLFPEVA